MKWSRKGCFSLFLLLLLLLGAMPALGQDQRVFDRAQLIADDAQAQLEEQIEKLRQELSLDLVVLTADTTNGKESRKFGDDFYDNGGFGQGDDRAGILLLIDMEHRQAYLSTCGRAIDLLTDERVNVILDQVTAMLKSKDYFGAVQVFLNQTASFIEKGIPDDQYQYDESTGTITRRETGLSAQEVIWSAALSVAAGGICMGVVALKYQYRYKNYSYPVREKSRVHFTRKRDTFLTKRVVTRVIQKDPPSGKGGSGGGGSASTTHTSSSGTTHGGGSAGF